jgi:hypothetical protein
MLVLQVSQKVVSSHERVDTAFKQARQASVLEVHGIGMSIKILRAIEGSRASLVSAEMPEKIVSQLRKLSIIVRVTFYNGAYWAARWPRRDHQMIDTRSLKQRLHIRCA